jgi:hypothetical protein
VHRGAAAWLLSLPVAVAGCLAAHSLAYRVVEPDAHERAHLLASSGHAYLDELRFLAAAGLALVLAGFVRQAAVAARGFQPTGPPRLVALVPPLAFVVQEHLERLLHDGTFPLDALAQPSFLVGLALQLPFAFAAVAVAALLTRAARTLGWLLAHPPRPRPAAAAEIVSSRPPASLPHVGARGRAPPLLARP